MKLPRSSFAAGIVIGSGVITRTALFTASWSVTFFSTGSGFTSAANTWMRSGCSGGRSAEIPTIATFVAVRPTLW